MAKKRKGGKSGKRPGGLTKDMLLEDAAAELQTRLEQAGPEPTDVLGRGFASALTTLLSRSIARFGRDRVLELLAAEIDTTPAFLAKTLRGKATPSDELIAGVVQFFGLPAELEPALRTAEEPPAAEAADARSAKKAFLGARKKRILVFRNGGLGDVLLSTPALRGLKESHPNSSITYLCHESCVPVLEGLELHGALLLERIETTKTFWPPYPEFDALAPRFDQIVNLYGAAESEERIETTNRIDAFCLEADVTPSDYVPFFAYQPQQREPDLISLQLEGSAAERTWPEAHSRELAERLAAQGYRVALLGNRPVDWDGPGLENLTGKLSFRESIDVLGRSAALVGPDSAFYHFAAVMRVPFVLLVGSFLPGLLLKHYRYRPLRCVYSSFPCAPCWLWPTCGIESQEEADRGKAPCMRAITVDCVLDHLQSLLAQAKTEAA